ncbi:hypothetical protein ERE07_01585 [Allopusillimonas ginsengisoli]|nr:hypothetical protein [Allopusillimonas ginsengisoli]TEA79665.1 hypothetical protein ERE07_01585 [Allopusillimonas ginsengisoli]
MRQIKIGHWPIMSLPAAIVAWESLRTQPDAGEDPAMEARTEQAEVAVQKQAAKQRKGAGVRAARQVCNCYLDGHIDPNRAPKGAKEIRRTFDTVLGGVAEMDVVEVTRSIAFGVIQSFVDKPVQAGILRRELGAAWDYTLEAGPLPVDTPNWWQLILRDKLRSRGNDPASLPRIPSYAAFNMASAVTGA